MSTESVKVPDLGGAANVEVIELCVTNGDEVNEGQSLIVVESDKASMEIPSPLSGKIVSIEVSEGAEVSEGDVILQLEATGVTESAAKAPEPPAAEVADVSEEASPEPAEAVTKPQLADSAERSSVTVLVPDLGGAESVEMIELLVAVGDEVSEGDGLMALESDKASMDLPSSASGVVKSLLVDIGAQLTEGMPVAEITVVSEQAVAEPAPEKNLSPAAEAPQLEAPSSNKSVEVKKSGALAAASVSASVVNSGSEGVYAGPAVRKLARELGVDLGLVQGSGPKSRITKDDLYNFVKQAVAGSDRPSAAASTGAGIPAVPSVDFSKFGEVDIQPMSKLHRLTSANMHRNWLNVPHVTQFDDADITELEIFRGSVKPEMEKRGVKLSPVPFLLKAVAKALQENPNLNVSIGEDGESIVYKRYVHIGMAVDTPAGLFVPVIRDVDKKGIWEIGAEVIELAQLAKERKLKPAQMQGACFTISSLGGIGGHGFTPIVNAPEVGILGVSRLETKPVFIDGEFVPRKMLPLSLSYDHRAVNGGDAGRFLTSIVAYLADMRRMLL